MSSKKWVITFIIFSLIAFGGIAGFNVIVDPFGVFGDHFFNWYSYNMTQNPRVAKVSYIDKVHENYDSYIIGCSSTSSYPVELLNKYTGDKFYNMIMYGADIYDSTETAKYLIENYKVKNMFLAVYLSNAVKYNYEYDEVMDNLHGKIDGSSLINFYSKYLFLHPNYGIEKLKAKMEDSYLQNKNDVFNISTGAYDKSKRDIEPIGSLDEYYETYPVFTNYPYMKYDDLAEIENCLNAIAELKSICDERKINFKIILTPLYIDYAKYYDQEDIDLFKTRLANITDFWDFTLSSVSTEPRFFYDEAHFRNLIGEMAVARIFGDESVYIPSDFGRYITQENVNDNLVKIRELKFDEMSYTKEVTILMYDKIRDFDKFEKSIKKLINKGYKFGTFEETKMYVEGKNQLDDKFLVLTFNDENVDNIEKIYKILNKYDIKAAIFLKNNEKINTIKKYKLLDIGLKMEEVQYIEENEFIDGVRSKISSFGKDLDIFLYRSDKVDELTEVILKEESIYFSLINKKGINTLVKGVEQSLRGLKYISLNEDDDVFMLIN